LRPLDFSTDASVGIINFAPHSSFFKQECAFLTEFSITIEVSLVSEDGFSLLAVLVGPFVEVTVLSACRGLHSCFVGEDVFEGAVLGVDVNEFELEGSVSF